MNKENREDVALEKLLRKLPLQKENPNLRDRVMLSFMPFSKEHKFGFLELLELLFGHQLPIRVFALASAAMLMVVGVAGGYAGGELTLQDIGVADLFSQAFSQEIFLFDPEMET